jgi:hypothetical protein
MRRALLLLALGMLGVAAIAHADVEFDRHDVQTIFFIDKSDDRNRVDYGIHLDTSCHPASGSPMVVYWREFENGHEGHVTHGLNVMEGPVYGVGSQRVAETLPDGMTMDIVIRALSSRHLQVHTARIPHGCSARATTTIAGTLANLDHVHLTLGDSAGSLRFADIYGTAVEGGAPVHEHVVH